MNQERLRLTAYHEAGHAVVSWVVGLQIEGASIEPQGSSLGRVSFTAMEAIEVYDEILHRRLISSYAGVKAVELCTGRPTDSDDPNTNPAYRGSDWDEVTALTRALAGSEESEQAALQERAEEEAQRILCENWRGVEAVAYALLTNQSLDSVDLSRILEEANCPRGEPVYEYELNKLANSLWELRHRYVSLIEEGRQEVAQRVAQEVTRVESEMEDLARSAERQDE
jgi:ATP-dependent Zn protease